MKTAIPTAAAVILSALILAGPARADGEQTDPVTYVLSADATFQNGCFESCACPLIEEQLMMGTFLLDTVIDMPPFQIFDITDVDWSVPTLDLHITGSGTFTIQSEFAQLQRLELDLQINNDPVQHFDSNWVLEGHEFPKLSVTVTINDYFCYDVVLHVDAGPILPGDLNADGAVDSADLAGLLGAWGACPPGPECNADLTGDAQVNAADLAMLLGNWNG